MIYLDHNATTPLLPAAEEAMRAAAFGNPASAHAAGRAARRHLEDAREAVARLLGAVPDEVVFTSGATEANNLALFGLCGDPPGRVAASPIEHPCVAEPLKQLTGRGFDVEWLPVNERGIVLPPSPLEGEGWGGGYEPAGSSDVRPGTRSPTPHPNPPPQGGRGQNLRLVSVQLANHETGAIQPVREFVRPGVTVHTDAAQAVGKIPVNFRDLGVTALTLSGHKFRGPKGVGALLLKKGTPLRPLHFGGHQQRGHRPGTEPVALALALAVALDHAVRTMADTAARLTQLRLRLLDRVRAAVPAVIVNGPFPGDADGLPTTLNLSFPGRRADVLLMALDLAGVAAAAGSACSSGSLLPSPTLAAMGLPDERLRSGVRFSLGEATTADEIDAAAETIARVVSDIR